MSPSGCSTAPATTEMFSELRRMRATQMTPAEMLLSKDSIARSLPGRFERGTAAAATFAELFIYDLPLDYFSTLPERINSVTVEQAQATAQKYIQPDKMIVLAVGDRAISEVDRALQKAPLPAGSCSCHLAGDRYTVYVPSTTLAQGQRIAEQLSKSFGGHDSATCNLPASKRARFDQFIEKALRKSRYCRNFGERVCPSIN